MPRVIQSSLIALRSILRNTPLFLAARPKTPLRVLCIMAFDMLHRLRYAKPMPPARRRTLAILLDFGACANAVFDNKPFCPRERRRTLRLLRNAGIAPAFADYRRRLATLERTRPSPGGDHRQFQKVVLYREAVVHLSLGMAAATTHGHQTLDEGIHATHHDPNLHTLFRIVMLCQVIDDALDYSRDEAAGLPSFLTACTSRSEAISLTREAIRNYSHDTTPSPTPPTPAAFPFRLALSLVSACTRAIVALPHSSRQNVQEYHPRTD
jgi:hypothetical protein